MKPSLPANFSYRFDIGRSYLAFSLLFFAWDVVNDILDDISQGNYDLFHAIPEALALGALLYALRKIKESSELLKYRVNKAETSVSVFKQGSGMLLQRQLEEVKLSKAEKEITLLILKGLSPSEISELRNTAVGTVKTQTTSIFRKFQVKSRSELISQLVHEVLDLEGLKKEIEQNNDNVDAH